MIELIFLVGGILVGMNIRQEMLLQKYNRTVEQVDKQIRDELEFYKNLSDSLKNDLAWEKHKNKEQK